jgi:hypothetical protein
MGWFIGSRMRCPNCGAIVPGAHTPGGPMVCENCRAQLQLSRQRLRASLWWEVGASVSACLLLGFRGWELVAASVIGLVPAGIVITRIQLRFFPPPLEPFNSQVRHWG